MSLELLEDRNLLSTASAITASFNGTKIPAGDTIWFDAALTASGLPKTGSVTIHADNGAIDFTAGGTAYHVPVPNGVIVLTAGGTSAAASFDPTDNDWDVSAPTSGAGDVFMSGVALPVSSALPGGIKNVTWSADFWTDTANVTVNWKWAAAVYKPGFGTDYNGLNVKPVDDSKLSVYKNSDQSGTPEAFKSLVTGGALGGGGTNYTGSFTGGKSVQPSLGDGLQDYPYPSSNPLTNVAFNESTVLRAANLDTVNGYFQLWYNDEHALALGVRQVNVITSAGTTTTNYPITAMTSNPGSANNPLLGSTAATGDQAGTDLSGRPITPSLYITDITNNPNDRSGDWQWGGTAYAPSDVYGTWKDVVRTVNQTTSPATVSVVCDADPVKNNWSLGAGSDTPPAGLANEGYGAEVRWSLSDLQARGLLLPGHTYRFYVIVHDGDQNKSGGDSGQASFDYSIPGIPPVAPLASLSGFVFADNGSSGRSGIGGVTVTLWTTNASGQQVVVMTTTTADDGSYSFQGLQAGSYSVTQGALPQPYQDQGYVFEGASVGTVNGATDGTTDGSTSIRTISLNAGDNGVDYDFLEFKFGGGI